MRPLDELLLKVLGEIAPSRLEPRDAEELRLTLKDVDRTRQIVGTWQGATNQVNSRFIDFPIVPIVSQVFEQNVSDFTVQIPSTYKHLMIMASGRITDAAADSVEMHLQFNGDTGASNYSIQRLTGAQATVSAGWDITTAYVEIDNFVADNAGAGENTSLVIHIPHYGSSFYKTIISSGGIFVSPTGSGASVWTGRWLSTDKITSIRFFPDTGTYANAKIKSGSLISVYGIQ